jgi:hypothetical protein
MKRAWVVLVAVVSLAAFAGALRAAGGGMARVRNSSGKPPGHAVVPRNLPPLPKGAVRVKPLPGAVESVSVLSFDDNTCEGGLGAGVQVSALVEFDPTPPCTNAGPLQILNVTARMNTGNAQDFVMHNPGATPQPANNASATQALSTPIGGAANDCSVPQTGGLVQRILTTPINVTPGNAANFFAGVRNTGFAGMDRTPPNANREWLLCAACGDTQYSPAEINALTTGSGQSLGGNYMIRVSVENVGCSPVELQNIEISD